MLLKIVRESLGRVIIMINYLTLPKPQQRSIENLAKVAEETKGLSMYQFYACPFCVKTRRAIHQLNLPIAYKDAKAEPYRSELASGGGKIQVPCLRIQTEQEERWLYESNDIINYLTERFAVQL